jgi:predicted TIM-barrel fold metal-dependent hydrolase
MDIVDAQVHVFHHHTESQMIACMDALGITGVVIDELWSFATDGTTLPCKIFPNGANRPLSPLAAGAALRLPDRFSLQQRVSRLDPELAALFAILSSTAGCRAVRIDGRTKAEQEALGDGGYDTVIRLARAHDLPVFLLIPGPETAKITRDISSKFSDVQFILDHCGRPESMGKWEDILTLSECPNLALKWCHPLHYFDAGPYPFVNVRVQLARAIGSFGARRIMWASDITVDRGGVSWADLLYTIREDAALSMSDKEWILGRTARTILKWVVSTPSRG